MLRVGSTLGSLRGHPPPTASGCKVNVMPRGWIWLHACTCLRRRARTPISLEVSLRSSITTRASEGAEPTGGETLTRSASGGGSCASSVNPARLRFGLVWIERSGCAARNRGATTIRRWPTHAHRIFSRDLPAAWVKKCGGWIATKLSAAIASVRRKGAGPRWTFCAIARNPACVKRSRSRRPEA